MVEGVQKGPVLVGPGRDLSPTVLTLCCMWTSSTACLGLKVTTAVLSSPVV